jgi:hypothetical protein
MKNQVNHPEIPAFLLRKEMTFISLNLLHYGLGETQMSTLEVL